MGNGVRARVRPDMAGDSLTATTPPDDTTLQGAYERHRDRVFDLCYHYLGQVADAEDAVQETFARAARRLPTLTGDRGAYLLAVARNLCCNELRRRRRVVPVESIDREDRGVEAERGIVERAVLERLWTRLSPRERSLIHDTFAGFSQQEIAGRVGLSPNAVAVALLRARQRARTYASRALAGALPFALAWRWVQRATRRAATIPAEASSAIALQIQQVGMVLTAALVGALATTAPALSGPALAGAHGDSAGATALAPGESAAPVASSQGLRGGSSSSLQGPSAGSAAPTGPVGVLDPLVNPGRNAPQQDVFFDSVTPSPNYGHDHTVFASGSLINGCHIDANCAVLYRSTDGGASWHNTNALNYGGGRLLLPPSWPKDPTMFAVGSQGLQRSTDGGQSFTLAVPVVAPAAIAPDSAPGNARVLIGANPLLVYSSAGAGSVSQGPVLPAGLTTPDDVAYAGDSQHILATAEVVSGDYVVSGQQTGAIVECVGGACKVVATKANAPKLRLTVSPAFAADRTAVATSGTTILESTDGGASFSTLQAPLHGAAHALVTFTPSGGGQSLVVAGLGSASPVVVQMAPTGTSTDMPSQGLPAGSAVTTLTALADGRLLAAISADPALHFGLLCLSPGATAWNASC
jgi:RNA polymerase sigma-70 factor, ECF subfamily